jgi:hypothetical protein
MKLYVWILQDDSEYEYRGEIVGVYGSLEKAQEAKDKEPGSTVIVKQEVE